MRPIIAHRRAGVDQATDGLTIARGLAAAGIPVLLARPAGGRSWDPTGGTAGCGYWIPRGWEQTAPDPAVIDRWEPGTALAAVMGHVVSGVDVDPRNGGRESLDGLPIPTVYGVQATPSGGWHGLIRALGVGSRDAVRPGVDVKDGRPDGTGRGFLWIAPTAKLSKTTGEIRAYRWPRPPDLTGIATDTTGAALADVIRGLRRGDDGAPRPPARPPADRRPYVTAALTGELKAVAGAQPGTRNQTLVRAAFALGQLIDPYGLDLRAVADALLDAAAAAGLPAREARATIRSGINAGRRAPRTGTAS